MTKGELLDILEGLPDDTEIRLAMQPNWSFEYSIGRAEIVNEKDDEDWEEEAAGPIDEENKQILYLAEGSQIGYLPGHVKDEIGW